MSKSIPTSHLEQKTLRNFRIENKLYYAIEKIAELNRRSPTEEIMIMMEERIIKHRESTGNVPHILITEKRKEKILKSTQQ